MHERGLLPSGLRSAWVAMFALLAAVAYWPGTSGGFLFDDWVNLPALGRYGAVDDLDALLRYLTSGGADPTGRPVSMLSFLVDARDWPADPAPFKRTNIILHTLNGLLLYQTLVALGLRIAQDARHARVAALLATGMWLLHPLWVSTVLYIIQRHAMLAALFVLAGVRLWVASDSAFRQGRPRRGWWLAVAAIGGCGLLAGLSKANGFLLPVLLMALNASVLRLPQSAGPGAALIPLRRARLLLVNIPAMLVVLGLLALAFTAQDNFQERTWTVGERLLTQPRIIWEYLYYLFVPGIDARGVFADGYQASTGLLTPPATALAMIALAGLAGLAWHQRTTRPEFAAATLFFLAGHLMESGALKLELYFEHRNYLPATLLFWPFTLALTRAGRYRRWCVLAITGFLMICVACTFIQTRLWSDPERLALTWATQLPSSSRAQAHAASFEIRNGRPEQAIARLEPLVHADPGDAQLALNLLNAHCVAGNPDPAVEAARHAITVRSVRQQLVYQWLTDTLTGVGHCRSLARETLHGFVLAAGESIEESSATPEHQARLHRLHALHALGSNDCAIALERFNATIDAQRRPEYAQSQTALLATKCGAEAGLAHLRHYLAGTDRGDAPMSRPMLRLHDRIIARQGMWENEWPRLEAVLLEDLERERAQASPLPSAPPMDHSE